MVHTLRLDNYFPTPRKLVLGTNSSFGTESIKIERGAGWDGLNLTATWHIPGREKPLRVALLDGDAMDVPPEVTKEAKDGVLVLAGLASGVQRASCNVEYLILEQAGVYGGADAEPTPELAAQVLEAALQAKADAEAAAEDAAAAKANADKAQADAEKAQQAAENAAANAAKAGPYAEAARAAQEAAESARDEAIAAQRAAENAAAAAAASKSAADTLAAEAARAAQAAENSKTTANNAANFAGENATAAQQAADTATAAANDAGQSASDAAASKAAAETAAKAAKDAQAAAAKSEANAKQSADTLAESVENVAANTAAVAELKEKKAEIDDTAVGANAWSSKHIIDMLCPPLEESGNPVVCYPVAGYPLGVKASWEPVQEGSGTPYPAGGGPNKLNVAGVVSSRTISGITFTINPDGTIGVNGTSTATCFLNPNTKFNKAYLQKIPAGAYRFDFEQTALSIFLFGYYEDGSEAPIVYAGNVVTYAQDAYIGMQIRVAAGVTVNTTARLMLHTGTSTPSAYAGWENIRPIKGRDSVTVERCGENLLNIKPFKKDPYKGITYEYVPDGGIHISGTATASVDSQTFPIWHLPPGKYYGLETGEEISASIVVQRNGKNLWINAKKEFTILAGDVTKYWYMITSTGVTVDKTVYPYIVPGTTPPTVYTPYTGQTNTLTLPETVYGGEVDAVTGDGKETWKTITLDGTEDCSFQTTNSPGKSSFVFQVPEIATPEYPENKGDIVCSQYPTVTANDTYTCKNGISVESGNNHYFRIYSDIYAEGTVDEWKSYLATQYAAGTPVQIAYKLAEPVPFTATGAQPMPALAGVNTVLTDADSATVTGRADPIKRITDLEDAVASQT